MIISDAGYCYFPLAATESSGATAALWTIEVAVNISIYFDCEMFQNPLSLANETQGNTAGIQLAFRWENNHI